MDALRSREADDRTAVPWPGVVLGGLLLACIGWVALSQQAPSVRDGSPPEQFQVDRAMAVLERLADAPHSIGQPNHGRARDFVIEVLQGIGYDVSVQSSTRSGRPTTHNVLAHLEGTAGTDDAILVAAHYDSVADAPGAADDGVGTVAVLESARALLAGEPLENDVIFLITDGEEQGLWGAWAFVEEHPWAVDVAFVLNFESGGPRGPVNVLEVDAATPAMLRTLATQTPKPVATSLIDDLVAAAREGGVGSSDFVPFRTLGQPGFNFANSKDTGFRHTPGDTFARIDPRTVQHQGDTLLGLVRAYGDRDLDRVGGDDDVVWVTLVTGITLAWSGTTAWLLLAAVLAMTFALARVLRSRGQLRGRAVARSLGVGFGAVGASILLGVLLVGLVQLVRPDLRPYANGIRPRLTFPGAGVPNGELYWFGMLGIILWGGIWLLQRTRRKVALAEMVLGTTLVMVVLAVLSTWGLRGASYLFTLPLLFLLPAHLLWFQRFDGRTDGWMPAAAVALGALPTALVGANLGVYFETFTFANVMIAAPLVVFFVVQLVPAFEVIAAAHPRLPVAGTGGLGVALLVVAATTVDPAPIIAEDFWLGDPGRNEVSRVALEAPDSASVDWSPALVAYDDDGRCVEVPLRYEPFAWCPLPDDVAVPIDVQQLRRDEVVLLLGNVADPTADQLLVSFEGGERVVDLETFEGVPGAVFLVEVPANLVEVTGFRAVDTQGRTVAERHGLELPRHETSLRHRALDD